MQNINENRKIRNKFSKEILNGNEIPTDELIQHKNEFFQAAMNSLSVLQDNHNHKIQQLINMECQSEPFSDEANTIDHVLKLRARFFKPTPREVIDARIAPLLASAPPPKITAEQVRNRTWYVDTPEDNDDDFWGDFFDDDDDDDDGDIPPVPPAPPLMSTVPNTRTSAATNNVNNANTSSHVTTNLTDAQSSGVVDPPETMDNLEVITHVDRGSTNRNASVDPVDRTAPDVGTVSADRNHSNCRVSGRLSEKISNGREDSANSSSRVITNGQASGGRVQNDVPGVNVPNAQDENNEEDSDAQDPRAQVPGGQVQNDVPDVNVPDAQEENNEEDSDAQDTGAQVPGGQVSGGQVSGEQVSGGQVQNVDVPDVNVAQDINEEDSDAQAPEEQIPRGRVPRGRGPRGRGPRGRGPRGRGPRGRGPRRRVPDGLVQNDVPDVNVPDAQDENNEEDSDVQDPRAQVPGGRVPGGQVQNDVPDVNVPDAQDENNAQVPGGQVSGGQVSGEQVSGGQVQNVDVPDVNVADAQVENNEEDSDAQDTGATVPGGQVSGGQVPGGQIPGAQVTGGQVPRPQVSNTQDPAIQVTHVNTGLSKDTLQVPVQFYGRRRSSTARNTQESRAQPSTTLEKFDECVQAEKIILGVLNNQPAKKLFEHDNPDFSNKKYMVFTKLWCMGLFKVSSNVTSTSDENFRVSINPN